MTKQWILAEWMLAGCLLLAMPALHAADLAGSQEDSSAMDSASPGAGVNTTTPSVRVEQSEKDGRTGSAQGTGSEPESGAIRMSNFAEIDRNQDGYISQQEAAERGDLNQNFSELDGNDDGQLSAEEFSGYRVIQER